MAESIMTRHFGYYTDPEEIRKYLEDVGHQVDERYSPDGKKTIGFRVRGTAISVSYAIVARDEMLTGGVVELHNSPYLPDYTAEKGERSLALYKKLQNRFSKPKGKIQQRRWLDRLSRSRRFRCYAPPDQIRKYINEAGHRTEDYYSHDGKEVEGFTAIGGRLRVSYDQLVGGEVLEPSRISLYYASAASSKEDPEALDLYLKLHDQFGEGSGATATENRG
jgi:hypothetical protein